MTMENANLVSIHNTGGYGSEFSDYESEIEAQKAKRRDLNEPKKTTRTKVAKPEQVTEEYNKEEGKVHRYHVLSLDAFSRHKKFINDYMLYYGGAGQKFTRDTSRDKRDMDVVRENHQFLWDEDDDSIHDSWEKRMAKKYYDKLFKEYCITDLSRYKENKIAMRWRIEKEVVSGKGQFTCGNRKCEESEGLRSWEVNFGYVEHGEKKNALVKLRLCPECSHKLNYHKKRREVKAKKRRAREERHSSSAKKPKTDPQQSVTTTESSQSQTEVTEEEASTSKTTTTTEGTTTSDDQNLWSGPAVITEEKTQEEEFDEYFEDMFL